MTYQQSTPIDESNWFVVLFDLVLQECLKSIDGKTGTFLWLLSPYLTNFRLPPSWPSFASNATYPVSDVENFKDLMRLVVRHGVPVKIQCYPRATLETHQKERVVDNHEEFIDELYHIGCTITLNPDNHSKLIACSQGALNSSANVTGQGANPAKQGNSGDYFPFSAEPNSSYQAKLKQAEKWFNDNKTKVWRP